MMTLRDELYFFIDSFNAGLPVVTSDALEQLAHHGDRLVPGLIELLSDGDAAIREFAVELLAEVRPRPRAAVPALVERLDDPVRSVQLAVVNCIDNFGHHAADAIRYLEPWLSFNDGYLRTLAATTILRIAPSRKELLSIIHAALSSSQPNICFLAREFCRKTDCTLEFNETDLQATVRRYWNYRTASEHVYWSSHLRDDGILDLDAAPVFQEVFGGQDDGKVTWADYEFDALGFSIEVGCSEIAAVSESENHSLKSFLGIRGTFHGQSFVMRLHLAPLENSEVREVYDSTTNTVRPKP